MNETYRREDSLVAREAVVNEYLDGLDKYERETAQMFADDFLQDGKPLANTLVLVPVAAHQEAPNVYRAMSQYARQETNEPFSVLLNLNYPFDHANDEGIQNTLMEIERARADFPYLDIRTSVNSYSKRPIIGEIRRDLWNGAMLAGRLSGCFDGGREVIGLNQDIDLVRMSRRYIDRIQRHYQRIENRHVIPDVNNAAGTQIKHAISPAHPVLSKAVFWNDCVSRLSGNVFEAGMAIPMSLYAKAGGFDPSDRVSEVFTMLHKGRQQGYPYGIIQHTFAETSPRRYVEKLDRHGWNVWHDDTFGANDQCRVSSDFPDLSPARLQDIVIRTLSGKAQELFSHIDNAVAHDAWLEYDGSACASDPAELRRYYRWRETEVHARLERIRPLVSRALLYVTGSPQLVSALSHYLDTSELTSITAHINETRELMHSLQEA